MILLNLILMIFLYMFIISLTYRRDIQIVNIFNIFGPIEYTIRYVEEFDSVSKNVVKYYKIYWNYFSILPFFRDFLSISDNQIVYTVNRENELISNYFVTYQSAKSFLYRNRDFTKFILNEE